METLSIQPLIDELDRLVPKDGAEVRLVQYGGGPDETMFVGTPRGYLRFGIEFLKGGTSPPTGESAHSVDVDLDYLIVAGSDVGLDWFERYEFLPPIGHADSLSWRNRVIGWVILAIVIAFVGCAVLGFFTAVQWVL